MISCFMAIIPRPRPPEFRSTLLGVISRLLAEPSFVMVVRGGAPPYEAGVVRLPVRP